MQALIDCQSCPERRDMGGGAEARKRRTDVRSREAEAESQKEGELRNQARGADILALAACHFATTPGTAEYDICRTDAKSCFCDDAENLFSR